MKQLIFTYEGYDICNLGDYIQSIAAKQFAFEGVVYHHRDQLSNYQGNEVAVIMNGWFTHKPENWPPSLKLRPLFVSFHINKAAYDSLLSEKSIKYLKQHEPIGCRDERTKEMLQQKGVDAYFSSCLTTTLGLTYKQTEERKYICIVEPVHFIPEANRRLQKFKFIFYYLKFLRGIHKYKKNLEDNNKKRVSLKDRNHFFSIIRSYILIKQILTKEDIKNIKVLVHSHYQNDYPTNEARFKRADELLKLYSNARLVITSRIHCALPCLGIGTPVVFMKNEDDSEESICRFGGLLDLLNVIKFKKNKIIDNPFQSNITSIKNKEDWKLYKDILVKTCRDFLQ